jgi:tRNA A37 threonylcarbamoyladenosine biosynthesis protein TsaE
VIDELIGREEEQAQLQAWVNDALAGRGSLVLLGGEAGLGKTTLARQWQWATPVARSPESCSSALVP